MCKGWADGWNTVDTPSTVVICRLMCEKDDKTKSAVTADTSFFCGKDKLLDRWLNSSLE